MRSLKKYLAYFYVLLMPISISTTSVDSSKTRIDIFGDLGQYALIAHSCDNEVLDKHTTPFEEIGGGVNYKVSKHFHAGLRGEVAFDECQKITEQENPETHEQETVYLYKPRQVYIADGFLRLDYKYIGLGASVLWDSAINDYNDESSSSGGFFGGGFLRLGPRSFYLRASVMYDRPLYYYGAINFGVGWKLSQRIACYLAANSLPYDRSGALFNVDYLVNPRLIVSFGGRYGESEGINETAVGLQLHYFLK